MGKFKTVFELHGSRVSADIASNPPTTTYCVLLTPRSGSTWLTREIARRDVLSTPDEYFNLEELPNGLRDNPAPDLQEYFKVVASKLATGNGIFGFQISYFDLSELEQEIPLLALMPGRRFFVYLSREDLIAQAVSLYIAVETSVFHSFGDDGGVSRQRAIPVPYDAVKIEFWASHILEQERGIEEWIRGKGVPVLRIQYEDMLAGPEHVVSRIADWIGVVPLPEHTIEIDTTNRLSSERNEDYCCRFVRDQRALCEHWYANRGERGRAQYRRRMGARSASRRRLGRPLRADQL